jgi:hypothetical protein
MVAIDAVDDARNCDSLSKYLFIRSGAQAADARSISLANCRNLAFYATEPSNESLVTRFMSLLGGE